MASASSPRVDDEAVLLSFAPAPAPLVGAMMTIDGHPFRMFACSRDEFDAHAISGDGTAWMVVDGVCVGWRPDPVSSTSDSSRAASALG